MRSLGRGGPSPQSEGVPGSLGPSALPSFPAVGALPVVLSRRGSAAALPRSPPARRGCSRVARTSRLRRLRSRRRPPRAFIPPPPPGLVSVSRPLPKARRLVSLSVRPLLCTPELLSAFSLWSPEPSCPSVSFHSSVRSQDGQPLPPSLVACFVCLLPPARPLWDLGQHRTAAWDARTRQCLLFQSSPHPGVGMGPRRLSPPTPWLRGTGHPVTLRSPPVVCRLLRSPV